MIRPRRIAVAAGAVLTLAAAPAGAQAKAPKPPKPDLSKVPKLKAIPPDLLAAFPVLRQKRATKVPNSVLRSWSNARVVRMFGVDPRQTRAIYGMKGSPWWVTPGSKGLCMMISAGGTCASKDEALAHGMQLLRVPAPTAPGAGPGTTFEGLAPAGFASVLVTLRTGATTAIPVTPSGAYRGDDVGPYTKVQLLRDGGEPVTLYEEPPPAPQPAPAPQP